MFNHKLPTDFPMQTLRKKTSPCKYKNEPGRFLGEGVSFRAKLIGVLEVPEARGDRMCQEALADLKMAIRAAGEHKQRIQVHVAIDGLRLRDDKTGDSLYHHPVHKISFIAQDMTDSRAFGYIFGSPDTGHRFFGIKTDKAASQVVIAMRDLFQVVFELKKKEVEMAKQQLEGKTVACNAVRLQPLTVEAKLKNLNPSTETTSSTPKNEAEGGVAELVDLEQELSSLRRGLTQVEGLTPNTDPFGDSFITSSSTAQKGLLPPPPSGSSTRGRTPTTRALFSPTNSLPFDLPVTSEITTTTAVETPPQTTLVDSLNDTVSASLPAGYDVFTDLDPLGTGRSKPYVDKKLFFQELKNPPKKVLKDLVPTQIVTEKPEQKQEFTATTTMTSLTRHSGGSVAIAKTQNPTFSGFFSSDPFAETDPFDNADPFSDSLKDDPFITMAEFPKPPVKRDTKLRDDVLKARLSSLASELNRDAATPEVGASSSVFNGPLQVSLPPEPAPKSPRLSRQNTDSSSVRQRPHSSRLTAETASPPPPLPPKKPSVVPGSDGGSARPPPRPPYEFQDTEPDVGPPLPKPARKKEPVPDRDLKPRPPVCASASSDEEYLPRAAPPLPAAKRLNITLAQLLTCSMAELADRLRVPAETLSSMTLPQLTDYLRSYLAADNDRARIHVETKVAETQLYSSLTSIPTTIEKSPPYNPPSIPSDFKPQFEDNFTPTIDSTETFVANFDDFDKKANSSYDRYAAFREIQDLELKTKSILDPVESPNGHVDTKLETDKDEPSIIKELTIADQQTDRKEADKSPLKSLDELTLDSFNMFRNSVSPKPSQIDAKIEDIKSVMKNLHIDKSRSVTPRELTLTESKIEDNSDRYAALREITITEPSQDEFESIPPEVPKERKRSDEKSDGFDNSDFFDCIDNSSLSFTHVEDAFRKSPVVKEREEERKVEEAQRSPKEVLPVRDLQPPPARLSTGSISDVASASSPDTKEKHRTGERWAVLGAGASPWSSDSRDSDLSRTRPNRTRPAPHVQSSSSSRDVSPWEEEPRRPRSHTHRDSRQNSSGSRECLDSGSGREKDRRRGSRERERETKDMSRRDSGSGRDRREVTHRTRRDKRSRDRDADIEPERDRRRERDIEIDERDRRSRDRDLDIEPERERTYSRDRKDRDYRDSRSRERPLKEHREKDRDRNRHRKSRHSYDENDDYSDGCGSGRSSPRERDRWSDRWRRDDRNYGSLGWRETRRRTEVRQSEDSDRSSRYGSTLTWSGRRREDRRRRRHDHDRYDRVKPSVYPEQDRVPTKLHGVYDQERVPSKHSVYEQDRVVSKHGSYEDRVVGKQHSVYIEQSGKKEYSDEYSPAPGKKRQSYSSLEATRFTFDPEESTASPPSAGPTRAQDKWWWSSESAAFEDDFTTSASSPRARNTSIAEEDEDLPPLPTKLNNTHKDIKKSESINIFTRESDPFENDAFFACTGSDKAARRENWPGDFQGFDNA